MALNTIDMLLTLKCVSSAPSCPNASQTHSPDPTYSMTMHCPHGQWHHSPPGCLSPKPGVSNFSPSLNLLIQFTPSLAGPTSSTSQIIHGFFTSLMLPSLHCSKSLLTGLLTQPILLCGYCQKHKSESVTYLKSFTRVYLWAKIV